MKRFSLLLATAAFTALLLATPPPATAAGTSATLTWTLATQWEDGTPLPASAIKETLIEWRRPGSTQLVGSVRVAAPQVTRVVENLKCGDFNFVAYTVLNSGPDSSATQPVTYQTGIECKPNPPGGFGVSSP